MPEVTVSQYADVIGIPVERLIEQLQEAGVPEKGPGDIISDTEKSELLGFLRRKHGKEESSEPKKITLKRKSISEIKVPVSSPGRAKQRSKTVSVEYRRRRTYARRGALEEEEARQKALEEEAAKAEEEKRRQAELEIQQQKAKEEEERRAQEQVAAEASRENADVDKAVAQDTGLQPAGPGAVGKHRLEPPRDRRQASGGRTGPRRENR